MSDTLTAAENATISESRDPAAASKFIWYELLTTDQDAAIGFYKAVVGWNAADQTMAELDFRYTILSAGDRDVAGLMKLPEEACASGAKPGWIGVIGVPDTDAAANNIVAAGGSIHRGPDDIPNVGRYAVVADPGGTVFELLTPLPREDEPPPPEPTMPGLVSWHELYAGQGEKAAFDFYSSQFGWETMQEMDMGPMGIYRIFGADGVQMGGMMDKPENIPVSTWGFYMNVDGIDAAVERIKANGGQVLRDPHEVPGGSWIVQATDPQGASFALLSTTR
jgi:predicted enzyme related to lactoylglutathione lyase